MPFAVQIPSLALLQKFYHWPLELIQLQENTRQMSKAERENSYLITRCPVFFLLGNTLIRVFNCVRAAFMARLIMCHLVFSYCHNHKTKWNKTSKLICGQLKVLFTQPVLRKKSHQEMAVSLSVCTENASCLKNFTKHIQYFLGSVKVKIREYFDNLIRKWCPGLQKCHFKINSKSPKMKCGVYQFIITQAGQSHAGNCKERIVPIGQNSVKGNCSVELPQRNFLKQSF